MIERYPTLESPKPLEHRFIFLCGLHQSGRSILHRLLSAHPQISGFHHSGAPDDEGELLQNVYPKSRTYGGPGKFCFSPEAYLDETSPLITNPNRVRLFAQWQPYWDVKKPFLLEKSASNIISSRFLQAMFPNSAFIFVTRHPAAVTLAMHRTGLDDMPQLVEHWSLAHRAMLADRAHLKQHITARFEDIIARPEYSFKILYDFLGLPPHPLADPLSPSANREYFTQWENYRLTHAKTYHKVMEFSSVPAQFGYVFDTPYVRPIAIDRGQRA